MRLYDVPPKLQRIIDRVLEFKRDSEKKKNKSSTSYKHVWGFPLTKQQFIKFSEEQQQPQKNKQIFLILIF